jgi:predicted alternative tryptophan synthase beta-subunit
MRMTSEPQWSPWPSKALNTLPMLPSPLPPPPGVKKLTTETGAGQWGSALAFATCLLDMECEVWQVRASYDAKPYRKTMMETW